MDQLLASFYPGELPQALENLPSSWPEVMRQSAQEPHTPQVSIPPTMSPPATQPAPTANRGIAVAVATLAACLMLIVFSNMGPQPEDTGTVEKDKTPAAFMPTEETIPVSDGATDGALDENNTSLQEIQQIDLAPPQLPKTEDADIKK